MNLIVVIAGIALIAAAGSVLLLPGEAPITGHVVSDVRSGLRVNSVPLPYNCNLTTVSGWNLVSFPCALANMTPEFIFYNFSGEYSSLHGYEPTDGADHWKAYNPDLPSWVVQDLDELSELDGYWMLVSTAGSINVTDGILNHVPIVLKNGWNLAGYPSNISQSSPDAFADINGTLTAVRTYNASDGADPWKVYDPSLPLGLSDLQQINPYLGYWINVTGESAWFMPLQ